MNNKDTITTALEHLFKDTTDTNGANWWERYEAASKILAEVDRICAFNEYTREKGNPDDELCEMEMIDDMDWKPTYAIERAFHGYRFNPFTDEHREAFNPNDEYFTFNGYGNLVSVSKRDEYRYWAQFLDVADYVDFAEDEGALEEIAEVLGVEWVDEDEDEDEDEGLGE